MDLLGDLLEDLLEEVLENIHLLEDVLIPTPAVATTMMAYDDYDNDYYSR